MANMEGTIKKLYVASVIFSWQLYCKYRTSARQWQEGTAEDRTGADQ
jgi:hypothetical protein